MMTGKLGTGLVTDSPQKPMELKFTDYSINKFQSDFSTGKKTIRTKILNSGIKGLKIKTFSLFNFFKIYGSRY